MSTETTETTAELLAKTIARLEKAVEHHSAAAAAATDHEDRAWHQSQELAALRILDLRRRFAATLPA
jgi:hypothetical protein